MAAAAMTTRSATRGTRTDHAALAKGLKRTVRVPMKGENIQYLVPKAKKERAKNKVTVPELTQTQEERGLSRENIIACQQADPNIQRLWNLAQGRQVYQPTDQERQDSEDLLEYNGIITKATQLATGETRLRIVVPARLQIATIAMVHNVNHAGVRVAHMTCFDKIIGSEV